MEQPRQRAVRSRPPRRGARELHPRAFARARPRRGDARPRQRDAGAGALRRGARELRQGAGGEAEQCRLPHRARPRAAGPQAVRARGGELRARARPRSRQCGRLARPRHRAHGAAALCRGRGELRQGAGGAARLRRGLLRPRPRPAGAAALRRRARRFRCRAGDAAVLRRMPVRLWQPAARAEPSGGGGPGVRAALRLRAGPRFSQRDAALHQDVLRRLGSLRRACRRDHLGHPARCEGDRTVRLPGGLELARRSQALRRDFCAGALSRSRDAGVDRRAVCAREDPHRLRGRRIPLPGDLDPDGGAVRAPRQEPLRDLCLRQRLGRRQHAAQAHQPGVRRGGRHREPRRPRCGGGDPATRDRRARRSQRLFRAGTDRRVRAEAGPGAGQLPRLSRAPWGPTTSTTSSPTRP